MGCGKLGFRIGRGFIPRRERNVIIVGFTDCGKLSLYEGHGFSRAVNSSDIRGFSR
jgi:hypothetical protein